MQNNFFDQALEILKIAQTRPQDSEAKDKITAQINDIEAEVNKRNATFDQAVADMLRRLSEAQPDLAANTTLLGQRISLADSRGLQLRAIKEFEDAPTNDPEYESVRPIIAQIYLNLGFADKAREQLDAFQAERLPSGYYHYFAAQVQLAAGDYENAKGLMEKSLAELRKSRMDKMFGAVENALRGVGLLEVRDRSLFWPVSERNDLLNDVMAESKMSFEYGLLLLEIGNSKEALKAFDAALKVWPRMAWYPIIRFYEKAIPNIPKEALAQEPPLFDPEWELEVKFTQPKTDGVKPQEAPKGGPAPKPDQPPGKGAPLPKG
jgi:tetratricopeptide (TPR) repeat protein